MAAFVPTVGVSSATVLSTSLSPIRTPVVHSLPVPLARANLQRAFTFSHAPAQSPGKGPKRILLWMNGALRVHDNPALVQAANAASVPGGALVPLYTGSTSPAVQELLSSLQNLGSGLVSIAGDAIMGIVDVCKKLKLDGLYMNCGMMREHVRLQKRVIKAVENAGVRVVTFWGNALADMQAQVPSLVRMRRELAKDSTAAVPISTPESLPGLPTAASRLSSATVVPQIGGGTSAALKVLHGMNKECEGGRISSSADLAMALRPFLNSGAISVKMVAERVKRVLGELRGATFEELVWRSYVCAAYYHLERIPAAAVTA